jgi:hypothetical protein
MRRLYAAWSVRFRGSEYGIYVWGGRYRNNIETIVESRGPEEYLPTG